MERINIDEILSGSVCECVVCASKSFLPIVCTAFTNENGERYTVKTPVSFRQRLHVGQRLTLRVASRATKKPSFECVNVYETHESK